MNAESKRIENVERPLTPVFNVFLNDPYSLDDDAIEKLTYFGLNLFQENYRRNMQSRITTHLPSSRDNQGETKVGNSNRSSESSNSRVLGGKITTGSLNCEPMTSSGDTSTVVGCSYNSKAKNSSKCQKDNCMSERTGHERVMKLGSSYFDWFNGYDEKAGSEGECCDDNGNEWCAPLSKRLKRNNERS